MPPAHPLGIPAIFVHTLCMSTQAAGGISPVQFVAKWSRVHLPERAASQEHFLDLCRMLGQPTPASPKPLNSTNPKSAC